MPEPIPTPVPTPPAPSPTPTFTPPAPTPPAPAPPAPGTAAPAGGEDAARRGGPDAVLADLASERDRRQAAEAEVTRLRAAADTAARASESEETTRVRTDLQSRADAATAAAAAAETRAVSAIAHLVRAAASRLAVAAGVPDERAGAFLRHVDLATVAYDPVTGVPQAAALQAAVDAGLAEAPEFRVSAGGPRRAPIYSAVPQGAEAPAPIDERAKVADMLALMQASAGLPVTPRAPAPTA